MLYNSSIETPIKRFTDKNLLGALPFYKIFLKEPIIQITDEVIQSKC